MKDMENVATKADLEQLGNRIIDDIGERLNEVMALIGAGQTRLESGYARLESRQEKLEIRMGKLEAGFDDLRQRITRLEGVMRDFDTRLAKVEGLTEALDADIRDFGKKLSDVQKKVDRLDKLAPKERWATARQVEAIERWAARIGQKAGVPFAAPHVRG